MKKKLLITVLGATFVAGPMSAAIAAPTVYGKLHLSVDRLDNDAGMEEGFLSSNSSQLGVRGDEDLGGGLKAIYQIRSALKADNGDGGLGGTLEDTFLGFSGAIGTLRFGRMDTPGKEMLSSVESFRDRLGDARAITAAAGASSFDNRYSNALYYASPKIGPLGLNAFYSTVETASATVAAPEVKGISAVWSTGALTAAIGRERHNGLTGNQQPSSTRIAAGYAFANFKILGYLERQQDVSFMAERDRDIAGVGVNYTFGNNVLKAQFVNADEFDNAANTGAKLYAIGWDHLLSKTTSVYADYAKVKNDSAATFTPGSAGHGQSLAAVAGTSPRGVSLGAIVKF